jgi:CheY-like chemotaxis protein
VRSRVGKGSCFSIEVPLGAARPTAGLETVSESAPERDASGLVLVIDDDPMVLAAMDGLLGSWGYGVITAGSHDGAVAALAAQGRKPDLIITDFHLSGGRTGIETIEDARAAFDAEIPAFLISGDTSPERLQQSRARGYVLLHKPVNPMTLRSLLMQLCGGSRQSYGDGPAGHVTA